MRRFPLLLAGALLVALILPTAVAAKQPTGSLSVPVTGATYIGETNTGGTFDGTFAITRFANQSGTLVAIGTVTGTVTDAADVASTIAPLQVVRIYDAV